MPNANVALDHDAQRSHLLVALFNELNATGLALSDLEDKAGDATFNQGAVDDLALKQAAVKARIAAIKAGGAFAFPSDADIAALGAACDALAQIDAETARAGEILTAAQAVLQALPPSATQAASGG